MAFKDLMAGTEKLTGAVADTAGRALDEFNEALPTMRALGFTIRDFHMSMALIPELSVKLVASASTIDVKRIDELITQYKDKKLLVALLKALQAAYHVKEQLGEAYFGSVEMDLTLALPPRISVGFVSVTETAAKAAA